MGYRAEELNPKIKTMYQEFDKLLREVWILKINLKHPTKSLDFSEKKVTIKQKNSGMLNKRVQLKHWNRLL